jgi:hypothetical protein
LGRETLPKPALVSTSASQLLVFAEVLTSLKGGDQRPDRHYDEKQDQDHDDQGYEGTPAHRTALLR